MIDARLPRTLTPEERRLFRTWARNVLMFYGIIAIALLGVAVASRMNPAAKGVAVAETAPPGPGGHGAGR